MAGRETVRASVLGCALLGVEAVPVRVEIEVTSGLPGMHIVGMGDTSVQEAKQRVRSAVRAAGFRSMSERHVTVNLAPASVRKSGSGYDLPIALAYLVATRQIDPSHVEGAMVMGELALEGSVRPVEGLFAYAACAQRNGVRFISGQPASRFPELVGLTHQCISHLADMRTGSFRQPLHNGRTIAAPLLDFKDVVGQESVVRALTVAAAGEHGLLMTGPPGSGKSMLARRFPSILPPLTEAERIETALIHSVAGLDVTPVTEGRRPFRSPHHSVTAAALVGGGRVPRPGEASLAHNGVLFIDELGECGATVLQALRQPLEEGRVLLSRAEWSASFPARFQFLAASNPCPCGYLGDKTRTCKCNDLQVRRYQSKLGGPLKDRIDLNCAVTRIDPARVLESGKGKSSALIASQVMAARERSAARGPAEPLAATTPRKVFETCGLQAKQRALVEHMARKRDLSGRAIVRILRVARTIADLEDEPQVAEEHLYEAFTYRLEEPME